MNCSLSSNSFGSLYYQCNICGKACKTRVSELSREEASCKKCGSSVRMRSLIHVLSMELFGRSLSLPEFPARPDISGMGLSDWKRYAIPLSKKLNYKNTYYHREPRIDITRIDPQSEGTLDFLISSDVFEHIPPPVSLGFENAYKLLKPNGVFIFTAPYTLSGKTVEHFPDLYDYQIIKKCDKYLLKNIASSGDEQNFGNLVFHGGPGSTLEMRMFSESSLADEFTKVGFRQVRIHRDACFEFGIYWKIVSAVPISARKLFLDSKIQSIPLPGETNNISFHMDRLLQTDYIFELEGWAHIKNEDSINAEMFIVLKSDKKMYVFDTKPVKRPDVTEYFKTLFLDNSGFYAAISKGAVEKGTYKAGCYIRKSNGVEALQFITTLSC